MHLAIACTFLLATIAFVQSKPILNNGNGINTLLCHVASNNVKYPLISKTNFTLSYFQNLTNQLSSRPARSIRSVIRQQRKFHDLVPLFLETPQLAVN